MYKHLTVADVMRLPSLAGAEVIAGRLGLSNPVGSVSVLEYGATAKVPGPFYHADTFAGNDLLLTAVIHIQDDVAVQCANVRRYHAMGHVGLVLYYVGGVRPELSRALIDACDELDFVLISMPPMRSGLQFSELVTQILFSIFREQQQERFFVSSILDRLSGLPPEQRNMDTLLHMLSERLRASVFLADREGKPDTMVFRPPSIADAVLEKAPAWMKEAAESGVLELRLQDMTAHLYRCPAPLSDPDGPRLYLLSFGEGFTDDVLWQAGELLRLFIRIWNQDHGKFSAAELVRAILSGDQLQLDRLANAFHIRAGELDQMWIFLPKSRRSGHDETLLRRCTDCLSHSSETFLIGYYEENLVAFSKGAANAPQRESMEQDLLRCLAELAESYGIVCRGCLDTVAELRNAYLNSIQYHDIARKIFPAKRILHTSDLLFAMTCRRILDDDFLLRQYLPILERLRCASGDIASTLSTYLLDADSSMAKTAQLLFVHLNTIKYRLRHVQELVGCSPSKMPDAYPLFVSAALLRALEKEADAPRPGRPEPLPAARQGKQVCQNDKEEPQWKSIIGGSGYESAV